MCFWFNKYTHKQILLVDYDWKWIEEGDLSKIMGTLYALARRSMVALIWRSFEQQNRCFVCLRDKTKILGTLFELNHNTLN